VPIAVITFDFDPLIRLADDLVVRWQTVALAAVIAGSLIVAGLMARRASLRADDLLYIAVGVVPGAVIGGRLGYALVHLDVFGADPARLVDPAVGGLDLAAAVVGGLLTGTYVASLLGAPVGRWAHLLAVPVLVVLGAGKLTMVLGGSGQGLPSDAAWATAYLGPGPWGSLAPALPSVPSQALEGFATLLLAVGVALVAGSGVVRGRDGRLLLAALAGWALLRALVAVTWRDPVVLGPWGAAGLLSLLVAAGMAVALAAAAVRSRRLRAAGVAADAGDLPAWPDPEARPRF
jgi:prolipoprotein diacylglyceryltransferase